MVTTGEVSNYLPRNRIQSGEAGSGESVGQDVLVKEMFYHIEITCTLCEAMVYWLNLVAVGSPIRVRTSCGVPLTFIFGIRKRMQKRNSKEFLPPSLWRRWRNRLGRQ